MKIKSSVGLCKNQNEAQIQCLCVALLLYQKPSNQHVWIADGHGSAVGLVFLQTLESEFGTLLTSLYILCSHSNGCTLEMSRKKQHKKKLSVQLLPSMRWKHEF